MLSNLRLRSHCPLAVVACVLLIILVTLVLPSTSLLDGNGHLKNNDIPSGAEEEDARLTAPQLIKKYGYPVETHEVTTKDGYVLVLFRIPAGRNNVTATREPVLLMHGFLSSAADWLLVDQSRVLPYLLADRSYDVWLGNCRGNGYSREHTLRRRDDPDFWDFSYHEMGVYDVPAMIDYILKKNGARQLNYIGHSMGTAMFYVCMSMYQEYNAKVRKMVALSPAVQLTHIESPAGYLQYLTDDMIRSYGKSTQGKLVPDNVTQFMKEYNSELCALPANDKMCKNAFFLLVGYNPRNSNDTTTKRVVGHTPSDASVRTLIHFVQHMRRPIFHQYCTGHAFSNILEYVDCTPPPYDLTRVTVPQMIFYGSNDTMVVPTDVQATIRELMTNAKVIPKYNEYNHLDFIYGDDAHSKVYLPAIEWLST